MGSNGNYAHEGPHNYHMQEDMNPQNTNPQWVYANQGDYMDEQQQCQSGYRQITPREQALSHVS